MSKHLGMCQIPQFQNLIQIRNWRQTHVANCMKCQLEIENRKIREQNWLKKMKEREEVNKLTKNILDLELEEYYLDLELEKYYIPSTPNSPQSVKSVESCSCNSTKGISEGFSLYNSTPEHHLHYIRDGYTSSDSEDNFDNFKLSPALLPTRNESSESLTISDPNSLDQWENIYDEWVS